MESKLDASTTLTVAEFGYDGSDRLTSIKDAQQDLSFSVYSGTRTDVTYNVEATGNPTTQFFHNSVWTRARSAVYRAGGLSVATELRDDHGRVTCRETDDSRVTKFDYTSSWLPVRTDIYGKTGDCTSGGTVERQLWSEWAYNTARLSWRASWSREKSQYSPAGSCTGVSLPAGCRETKYEYVSSTDDRVQWVTQTGSTRLTNDSVASAVIKYRTYYFGLDTGTCPSSGDWYTGLTCRTETQDGASTVYAQSSYTYVPSGTTAGLAKSIAFYRASSDSSPLTTTFASHNAFGTPLSVTAPSGVVTSYTMNGWNAPTQIVETGGLLDAAADPAAFSTTTNIAYNKLRRPSTTTLPKGNQEVSRYYTGATDYARLKANARADASGNLQEIVRYVYDKFGNTIEDRTLDSINGTTPCADEDCTTYEVRRERKFNALRQITEAYLHASDQASPPDGTQSYTYTSGQLTAVSDYRGTTNAITYDSQGRPSASTRDSGGIAAQTQFAYDAAGRASTVTAPAGVATTYEYDDFGRLVLERTRTRGDLRHEFDASGTATKRRRTSYASTTSIEDTCYTSDWLGRQATIDYACDGTNWTFGYDGDTTPAGACPNASKQRGHLTLISSSGFTRALCYHPAGALYASYQLSSSTWSNTTARGTQLIYDANGNLTQEFVNASPASRAMAREIETVYDTTSKDRVRYVRHRLNGESWTDVTSSSVNPTYFAYGGMRTLTYANGIVETNERDFADRLKRRQTKYTSSVYTDINLSFDLNGNVTRYDDSTGYRHVKYDTAMDKLDRLRCLSRATISSCAGSEPWESKFLESFDYDSSGNRTNRRSGAFNTADDDAYTYVSGPTDIIDRVTSGGTAKEMSNTFKGELSSVNDPNLIQFTFDYDSRVTATEDAFLGSVAHYNTPMGDRYAKKSPCNARMTYFRYRPDAETGTSPFINFLDAYGTCAEEYPREQRTYVYLEGRPIAIAHATLASSGASAPTAGATYWLHSDHLGTPVLVTNASRVERWRWENDPFGCSKPVEYTVSSQDVSPDDDSSSGSPSVYNTCCCTTCGVSGCGLGTASCAAGCCAGASSQAVVWTKTYAPSGANNVRLHFSQFNVAPGATRTSKDYVRLENGASTVVGTLTGDLGDFWGPWSGDGTQVLKLYADNTADGTRGVVVDQLEYTTSTNGRYVMHLRMPGQLWDEEVQHAYNFHRWYRAEDGRYVSPEADLSAPRILYARPQTAFQRGGPVREVRPTPQRLVTTCTVQCNWVSSSLGVDEYPSGHCPYDVSVPWQKLSGRGKYIASSFDGRRWHTNYCDADLLRFHMFYGEAQPRLGDPTCTGQLPPAARVFEVTCNCVFPLHCDEEVPTVAN